MKNYQFIEEAWNLKFKLTFNMFPSSGWIFRKCHLTGCRSEAPTHAFNAKAPNIKIEPENPYSSAKYLKNESQISKPLEIRDYRHTLLFLAYRTACGINSKPSPVPVIVIPTACPLLFLK